MAKQRNRSKPLTENGVALIEKVMQARGWDEEKLAIETEIGYDSICRYLKRERSPENKNIKIIAQCLGLKPSDLVEGRISETKSDSDNELSIVDWRSVSKKLLDKLKRLTTESLTAGDGIRFNFDDIFVPLGVSEKKEKTKQAKESITPENDLEVEQQNKEEGDQDSEQDETVTPISHDAFFEDVLLQGNTKISGGKRLAIIGEAGAGKTTQLQRIGSYLLEESDSIPIWVSLSALGTKTLNEYILAEWVRDASGKMSAPQEWQDSLEDVIASGKVWLLLDGVDEMTVSNGLSCLATQLRESWLDNVRVVLTCRNNVWDAGKNELTDFDVYRNLDFEFPEGVHKFIDKWFVGNLELAERLKDALAESGKELICDTVRNPLRLTLLCYSWQKNQGTLPETKAGLYAKFVDSFYEWNKGKIKAELSSQKRRELNLALSELAKRAIDNGSSRFRLTRDFVESVFNEFNLDLLDLAINLNWLVDIGVVAASHDQKVYSFYHPSFQEYFAALTVDQDFFLPKNHVDQPVEGSHYRLFESKWQEVLTIWLGRSDVSKDDRLNFKKCLTDFQSGVGDPDYYDDFYSDSAKKIANMISDEGDFNKEKPSSYQAKPKPIEEKNERNSRYRQPTFENIDAAISKLIAIGLANSLDQLKLPISEIADLYYSLGLDPAQIALEILSEWRESNYFGTPFNYLVSRYIEFEKEEETKLISEQFFENLQDSMWCISDAITGWHNSAKYSVALGKSWRAFDDFSNRELDLLINLSSEEVDAIYENAKRQISDNEEVIKLLAENQAIRTVLDKHPIINDWLRETCHTIKNIFTDGFGAPKPPDDIVYSIRWFTITKTLNLIKEGKYSLEESSQGKLSLDYRFEMFASLKDFFEMESSDISLITQEVINQFNQAKDSILSDAIAAFRNSEEDIDTQFKTIERLNNFRAVKFLDGCHFNPSVDQQFNQIKEQTLSDAIALLQHSTRDISVQFETIKKLNDFRQTYLSDSHDLQPETIEAWNQIKKDIFGNAINLCKDTKKDLHERIEVLQALTGFCESESFQGSPLNQILFEILLSMQPEMIGDDTIPYNSKDWTYSRLDKAVSAISELYGVSDGVELDGLDFIYDLVKDLSAEYYPQISDLLIKLHLTLVRSSYEYSGTDGNSNPAFDTINRLALEKADFKDYFVELIEKTRPNAIYTGYTIDFDLAHYLKPESRFKYLYDEVALGYPSHYAADTHVCVTFACINECVVYHGNRDICEVITKALRDLYVDNPTEYLDYESSGYLPIEALENIMTPDLYELVISYIRPLYSYEPKAPHNNREDPEYGRSMYFGELIYTISQNMSYPEFYKLWHSYDSEIAVPTVETPTLNETELLQALENQFIDLDAVQKEIDRNAGHPKIRCLVVDIRQLEQESDPNVIAKKLTNKIFNSIGRRIPVVQDISCLERELLNLKFDLGVEKLAIALYGKSANEAIAQLCQSLTESIPIRPFTGEKSTQKLITEINAWLSEMNVRQEK